MTMTRHAAAQRLDITLEMARKHGIPSRVTDSFVRDLEENPPAWLAQSQANRKAGGRPVWVTLVCDVCGFTEAARPKKWWPEFSYLSCDEHVPSDLPAPPAGMNRQEVDGIGSRFVGLVDRERVRTL